MLAYSLQIPPDNETLSFYGTECSTTQFKSFDLNDIVSVDDLDPLIFGAMFH